MIARLICWWQGHTPPHSYWVTAEGIAQGTCPLCGTAIWSDVSNTGQSQDTRDE